jgi:predicted site-specific integrase-resolvase
MGRQRYPNARELTATADCGGSNGARVRLWTLEPQKLADETGLAIRVRDGELMARKAPVGPYRNPARNRGRRSLKTHRFPRLQKGIGNGDAHMRRAAIYLRVSTQDQTTANQERELREVATRMGCEIVVYRDHGVSGAKGRDKRPQFDKLCRDATQRRFDVVMAWSVDRLGRSLQGLVEFLTEIHALKIDLYLHQQGIDTATPAGEMLFQMMAVFAEFDAP